MLQSLYGIYRMYGRVFAKDILLVLDLWTPSDFPVYGVYGVYGEKKLQSCCKHGNIVADSNAIAFSAPLREITDFLRGITDFYGDLQYC